MMTPFERAVRGELEGSRGGRAHVQPEDDGSDRATPLSGTQLTRVESDRWVLFRSHYGFDVFYCRPGVEGAHEKGGVEGEGGRFRLTHTVPMPKVDTRACQVVCV